MYIAHSNVFMVNKRDLSVQDHIGFHIDLDELQVWPEKWVMKSMSQNVKS